MELADIAAFLESIPTWVWVVVAVVAVFAFFGEKILWDFEVKFPYRDGVGRGEVEFECGSKRGSRIECVFEFEQGYRDRPIEICLNGRHVFTVPAEKSSSPRLRLVQAAEMDKPAEGDEVEVRIGADRVFSGSLELD